MMQMSNQDQAIRERAYYLWESEERPEGRALDHWLRACSPQPSDLPDEEKLIDGRPDVDLPALLTKDVKGG
jgi:hypothetical protein